MLPAGRVYQNKLESMKGKKGFVVEKKRHLDDYPSIQLGLPKVSAFLFAVLCYDMRACMFRLSNKVGNDDESSHGN